MGAQAYAPICRWRAFVRERAGSLVARLRLRAPEVDVVLGLALGIATVVPVISKLQGVLPWTMTVLAGVVVAAAVATRRRWPLTAVVGASLTVVICASLHGRATDDDASLVALLLLVYTVAAQRPAREAAIGLLVATGAALTIEALGPNFDPAPPLVLIVPAFFCGRALRRWRLLNVALEQRAAALAEGREAQAALAVRDERMRIARELHDVVGHAVSLIVIQATAGRRVAGDRPDRAREVLDAIDLAGKQALTELSRLAALVADPEDATRLTLGELVRSSQNAGLEVHITDRTPGKLDPLALRVIQEALTNTLKHAGPTRVEIQIIHADERLTVRIADQGPCRNASNPPVTGGHGLIGMTERVALAGGNITAGPRPGGGWEVYANMPIASTAPPQAPNDSTSSSQHPLAVVANAPV